MQRGSAMGTGCMNGRLYSDILTVQLNDKGVLDVDVVKGCTAGMAAKEGGCYGACYAATIAKFRGIDFAQHIVRKVHSLAQAKKIEDAVRRAPLGFFRVGTMGDPCHAWEETTETIEWLAAFATPVIVTKHWMKATDEQFKRLINCGAILNTSVSAIDTPAQLAHRERELMRYERLGGLSFARIVSCDFNTDNEEGAKCAEMQARLFTYQHVIDNPLRVARNHPLVQRGVIRLQVVRDLNAKRTISIFNPAAYIGHCNDCPDQCGLSSRGADHPTHVSRQHQLMELN